jgi:hypothetical protein
MQKQIITRLARDCQYTRIARVLLDEFRKLEEVSIADRDRIARELGQLQSRRFHLLFGAGPRTKRASG